MSNPKPLVCTQCGASINPKTYICEYCGTKFDITRRENGVCIWSEELHPGVDVLNAVISISEENFSQFIHNKEEFWAMVRRNLLEKLTADLAQYVEFDDAIDIDTMSRKVRARVRVIKPGYRF